MIRTFKTIASAGANRRAERGDSAGVCDSDRVVRYRPGRSSSLTAGVGRFEDEDEKDDEDELSAAAR